MEIKEYQERALATAIYSDKYRIIYPSLGVAGEAGEIADKAKKVLRDNNGVFTDEIKLELAKEVGDVLWYCNALSNDLGYSLTEIMEMNITKLESRMKRNVIGGSGDNR